MQSKEDFEKSLKVTKLCLLLSGTKSDRGTMYNKIIEYFINNLLFYLNIFCLYGVIIGEILWIIDSILIGKKIDEAMLMVPCVTLSVMGTVKVTPLFFRRGILVELVENLKNIHPETTEKGEETADDDKEDENADKLETKLLNDAVTHFDKIVSVYFVMSMSIVSTFCIVPILLMMYDYFTLGEYEIRLPFSTKYFFDISKSKLWMLVYVHQVYATVIVVYNMMGADSLFYASCNFIHMHFKLLKVKIEYLIGNQWDEQIEKTVIKKLKDLIIKHQMLIQIVAQIEKLYSYSSLFNLVASSLLICLSGFILSTTQHMTMRFCFAAFTFSCLTEIAIVCYGGDLIMQSSQDISLAVYNSRWYLTEGRIKRSLLITLIRAQRPCKLTAGNFADLNLMAFATVLRRSWSYFALLKTMYN